MKKLFLLTAIASSLFLTSCSSEDADAITQPNPISKTLILSGAASSVADNVIIYKEVATDLYVKVTVETGYPSIQVKDGDKVIIANENTLIEDEVRTIRYKYNQDGIETTLTSTNTPKTVQLTDGNYDTAYLYGTVTVKL